MEFFAIADVRTDGPTLQAEVTLERLAEFCASIDAVIDHADDHADIYSVWGEFRVFREEINGGVRFTLPKCPNAFAWTVTTGYPPAPGSVVVHGTINRTEHDPDFIETLEQFVEDWRIGLERSLAGAA